MNAKNSFYVYSIVCMITLLSVLIKSFEVGLVYFTGLFMGVALYIFATKSIEEKNKERNNVKRKSN